MRGIWTVRHATIMTSAFGADLTNDRARGQLGGLVMVKDKGLYCPLVARDKPQSFVGSMLYLHPHGVITWVNRPQAKLGLLRITLVQAFQYCPLTSSRSVDTYNKFGRTRQKKTGFVNQ